MTAAAKEKMASSEISKMQLQLYLAGSTEHDESLRLLHSLRLSFVIADAQNSRAESDSPTS
jgi:predicted negative regulator of RcsB-dependent stress response